MAAPFFSSSWYRVAQLRPELRDQVSVSRQRHRGKSWYVLHDHVTGRAYRLSPGSYMIVGSMDAKRTVDQLWQEAATCLGQDAPTQGEFIQLLAQLTSADLLQTEVTPDLAGLFERAARASRSSWLRNLLNPMALRLSLWHPDRFFDRTQFIANLLFNWPALILWIIVVLPAIALAALHWQTLSANAADRILRADNILIIALIYPVLKALHELGHGYAVKAFGGVVQEIGVMFLVFAPMPYVDASSAAQFRSKWQRATVGAAGMIVEIFIAALALYVWLVVEPGLIQAFAYNLMFLAGASTVLFNGNPLLRFDGYYILSDILEIPNLAQRSMRYWRYLVDRCVFNTEGTDNLDVSKGECVCLVLYAPLSFGYRIFIMLVMAVFLASEYLVIGVAIAIWGICTTIMLPIIRAFGQVIIGPRYHRNRHRVVLTAFGIALGASIAVFWIPAPLYTSTEGVVWLPESASVRAAASGFVRQVLVEPGRLVKAGDALVESEEPTLNTELQILRARVAELDAMLTSVRFSDRAKAQITTTELGQARAELATANLVAARLVTRSPGEGIFAVIKPRDLPGRFVKEGDLLGYVLPPGSRIIRATIRQDDIGLVRNQLRQTRVMLSERMHESIRGRIVREVPAGRDNLPSKALGEVGGGALPVDPHDAQGTKSFQRVFQVDIELASESASAVAFGSRAYIRFDHHWEPIGRQIWRRARQLLLSRLQA